MIRNVVITTAAMLFVVAGSALAQDAKPPVMTHDMAGKENCAMCHDSGAMGAPKAPASHEGFKNENCMLCHAETSPLQAGNAPPAIPHDLEGKENCAMCHGSGVMGAPKAPESHKDFKSENCGLCHKPAS